MVSSMNRVLLLLLLSFGCLQAQTSSAIRISSSPAGARFLVDGQLYNQAVTFNWPRGSEHVVVFITDPALPGATTSLVQTSLDGATQFVLTGWTDNKGLVQPTAVPFQVITADPSITTFTAQVAVAYRLSLNFFNSGIPNDAVSPPTCG